MARWVDKYHVGQVVEFYVQYADGPRWQDATIVGCTSSGNPKVRPVGAEGFLLVAYRKTEIRPSTPALREGNGR
jgi:hypothetical protein